MTAIAAVSAAPSIAMELPESNHAATIPFQSARGQEPGAESQALWSARSASGSAPSDVSSSNGAEHAEPQRAPSACGASGPQEKRSRKPWRPSWRDRLIHQWVRFDGLTQDWVASQMDISQSTVSRIVQRYDRWVAHAEPGEIELEHEERLRAQRWLAYERNERMLAKALRLSDELEKCDTTEKTVTSGPHYIHQEKVRVERTSVDRTGMIARYIRLAFRINMEQLKLVEKEPLPPLPPLDAEEIEELERLMKAREKEAMARASAEMEADKLERQAQWGQEPGAGGQEPEHEGHSLWSARSASGSGANGAATSDDLRDGTPADAPSACGASGPQGADPWSARSASGSAPGDAASCSRFQDAQLTAAPSACGASGPQGPTPVPRGSSVGAAPLTHPTMHGVHKMHNAGGGQNGASHCHDECYDPHPPPEKNLPTACIPAGLTPTPLPCG